MVLAGVCMTTVITYGTFDLFHIGHLNLLSRARALGSRLVVGVSTDGFNALKAKRSIIPFEDRRRIVAALSCVDDTFGEDSWDQKRADIRAFGAGILAMGADWTGRFDDLGDICRVVYLDRTEGISTTELKTVLSTFDRDSIQRLKEGLDSLQQIVARLDGYGPDAAAQGRRGDGHP